MAEFDESKVINALHTDKAEVGKKYWFADNIVALKEFVENDNLDCVYEFEMTFCNRFSPKTDIAMGFCLLYPYEEPPKQRMTNLMLAEWLAKGNGQKKWKSFQEYSTNHCYYTNKENDEVDEKLLIRPFRQTEWIKPTVDIYERDCKGGKE